MSEINAKFEGVIYKEPTSGWTSVDWPDSKSILGTGKTVKVNCRVDNLEFPVTLMPNGTGCHMLPLKADVRKKLKKDIGDSVSVVIISLQ